VEKPFEVIDHTADIGIVAYGADIKQVFANAALGLFNLMADLDDFEEGMQRDLELSAGDVEVLLIEWLNELIYIFDVEHIIFKKFEIEKLTSTEVKARCFGEKMEPGRHKLKREVKAATYHMLRISKEDGTYKVQVIFDI
jgi:SHS2 domain-containing protein